MKLTIEDLAGLEGQPLEAILRKVNIVLAAELDRGAKVWGTSESGEFLLWETERFPGVTHSGVVVNVTKV